MSTRKELLEAAATLGIEVDPKITKAGLEALLAGETPQDSFSGVSEECPQCTYPLPHQHIGI